MNYFSDSKTLKLISLVMIKVIKQKASKNELLYGHCHQNSGQKQLASDMKIEKKASKSGASAS